MENLSLLILCLVITNIFVIFGGVDGRPNYSIEERVTDESEPDFDNEEENNRFIPYMCVDENDQPSKDCYGGWFYKSRIYGSVYNAKFAKLKNWNYVLLSANIKQKDSLIANVQEFRKQNITVHLMTLEDTGYLDNPGQGYSLMKQLLNFVNEYNLDIQGVHIDCEPHAHPNWKNGSVEVRNAIFQNYIRVIEECRQAVNEVRPNVTLSAAVAWWYSSRTQNNELENGRGYDLVNEDRLDFIIPMIYDGAGGTAERVLNRAEDYLTDNASTVIGIAYADYNENLNSTVTTIIERSKMNHPNYFNGISIFSNHLYEDWGNELDDIN
ncbi:hypothetical protein H8356DRAFT_1004086 [Neocallimastix lanati (nom. inval.)]|uniref:GH18 domain-containing protein n=1 Tax=Neocallimastix californiae TaxID=1754190 RepID=A0A1Y2D4H3_9FUNG|nr:hypothetical protein H8356DRAFT_1004086 [Neocallimastix sp. JGI-2020a]ORY54198.1 hypothetical protein LY90DRAFT_670138 [Neocallimastix californiae]|eukprot:ORY54198.1 hypothetical protein LY90DRAFT_670138 [Neocallimastix californiae]